MSTEYVPLNLEECTLRLEDLLCDLDDTIQEHGEESYDAKDIFRTIKWVLDGAVKAGYIENNIPVDIPNFKTVVWHNTFGNYEYADAAYWKMKDALDASA